MSAFYPKTLSSRCKKLEIIIEIQFEMGHREPVLCPSQMQEPSLHSIFGIIWWDRKPVLMSHVLGNDRREIQMTSKGVSIYE